MQAAFTAFIKKENLFLSSDKILLAVSGGIDSVVMCELFHKASFNFGIAHCNFQLRGKESDNDEKFVKVLAKKYNVPFYSKRFNTSAFVSENKLSIQMAARKLRYEWFEEIRKNENYRYISTAHHQDDSIETFFINIVRGTGIGGLHGILPKQGNIVRPLLFAAKNDIINYAEAEELKFREDSSNASDKYMRNKIRNHIIPTLKEINLNLETTIYSTIIRLRGVEQIYRKEIEKQRKLLIEEKDNYLTLNLDKLDKLNSKSTYIYELLKPFNFNENTTSDIIGAANLKSGSAFFSSTHRISIDRKTLIIEEISQVNSNQSSLSFFIKKNQKEIHTSYFTLKIIKKGMEDEIIKSNYTASLDYDKLKFPLEIRKWREGDSFYPLGMKGKKKLSDFFIDNKLPLNRKENTWLLTSDGKIAWIIGMRIDNRFKVTDKTRQIYFAELLK